MSVATLLGAAREGFFDQSVSLRVSPTISVCEVVEMSRKIRIRLCCPRLESPVAWAFFPETSTERVPESHETWIQVEIIVFIS